MKTGQAYKAYARSAMSLIEYHQKEYTKNGITRINSTAGYDVNIEQLHEVILDLMYDFGDELEIVKFYDHVNEEHWIENPPRLGAPRYHIAELKIKSPIGRLKSLMEDEFKRLDGDTHIEVIIDSGHGLYLKGSPEKNYPMRRKGKGNETKRMRLLRILSDSKIPVSGGSIAKRFGMSLSLLSKEVSEINTLSRKDAGVYDDLIVSVETGGYEINKGYRISFR